MKPDAPCRDCKDRAVGCHGRCEAYKEFQKDRSEYVQGSYRIIKECSPYYTKVEWTPGKQRVWRSKR